MFDYFGSFQNFLIDLNKISWSIEYISFFFKKIFLTSWLSSKLFLGIYIKPDLVDYTLRVLKIVFPL